jgi:hypothetical protein
MNAPIQFTGFLDKAFFLLRVTRKPFVSRAHLATSFGDAVSVHPTVGIARRLLLTIRPARVTMFVPSHSQVLANILCFVTQ